MIYLNECPLTRFADEKKMNGATLAAFIDHISLDYDGPLWTRMTCEIEEWYESFVHPPDALAALGQVDFTGDDDDTDPRAFLGQP